MLSIDLNCDLGESFGAYRIGMDEAVIPLITSANIACGFHAGDPLVIEKTVAVCKEYGVNAGAHPGFPDLSGFGRRNMTLSLAEVKAMIKYQVGAVKGFCEAAGIALKHVKPHGALYNMAARDYDLALAICEAVKEINPTLVLFALSGSQMVQAAHDTSLSCASEVFADRAYQQDGSLVPRGKPGAVIEDESAAIAQVVHMVRDGQVKTLTGEEITIQADSVCVHGDGTKALTLIQAIKKNLENRAINIEPFTVPSGRNTYL